MATHALITSTDLSAILRDAWRRYRLARPAFNAAGDVGSKRVFLRTLFAKMLRMSWADALAALRSASARAAREVAAQLQAKIREGQIDLARRMSSEQRSARIVAIRGDIAALDYAPLGMHIRLKREALSDELAILNAA